MRTISTEQLVSFQKNVDNIRNICILAHVDHGKTTLADALVARNGIISSRMAGKMRYMDSRKDEQERGITMKSSAIALHHLAGNGENYLINLIDSPGHVDFSSEVSTAVRLCDGALIVVDVVEGVCPQTKFAIRQAWMENLTPILVLNKIDRLIIEKKITPIDAHIHLMQILEQTNAVMGELFATNIYEKATQKSEEKKQDEGPSEIVSESQVYDWDVGLDDSDDSTLYFAPEDGNVIFASAYDRWGFSLNHFADLYSKKLGIQKKSLLKTLWGDYYVNIKAKKIMKGAQAKTKKPLFVQFILENIWKVYETCLERRDKDAMVKMCDALNVKVQTRDMRHNDPRVFLQAMFCEWLPLGKSVLELVSLKLPSPNQINEEKFEKLFCGKTYNFTSLPDETQKLKNGKSKYNLTIVIHCVLGSTPVSYIGSTKRQLYRRVAEHADILKCSSNNEAPVIAFISKMFPVEVESLPQNKIQPLTREEMTCRREEARAKNIQRLQDKAEASINCENDESTSNLENDTKEISLEKGSDHVLIAFARIFSGTIRKNQRLFVLGPKHNPMKALENKNTEINPNLTVKDLSSDKHITSFVVSDLYMLMGRDVESVDEVGAGNVFGIGRLQDHVLKTATISSTIACPSVPTSKYRSKAYCESDMAALMQGLRLLNQADASVEVFVQETGEHVLVTAGEVHLQRCIDDLEQKFANISINVSSPIVPFRETIIDPPKHDMVNEAIEDQNQVIKSNLNSDSAETSRSITVYTPDKKCRMTITAKSLPKSVTELLEKNADLLKIHAQWLKQMALQEVTIDFNKQTEEDLNQLRNHLNEAFNSSGEEWINAATNVWSFGPRRFGPNVLLNRVKDYKNVCTWWDRRTMQTVEGDLRQTYNDSFVNGFLMATMAGPLCEEPMMGVCFVVEEWEISNEPLIGSVNQSSVNRFGPLSGQIMAIVKDSCRQSFQAQPQRLMAAMYSCNTQATVDVLGK
ncbi:Elongation factor-like GTPase 1 [Nymphon striatum]|nr:Elongation factor-like GTPase 1 [Nymphon striatum]